MNTRPRNTRIVVSLSALALAGALAGQGIASADNKAAVEIAKAANADARRAVKALARHRDDEAVGYAEHAVTLAPRSAEYRMLLGQSYLQAGRFRSAASAFADTVALDPATPRAALNLALMQVATGDWGAARQTLDAHATRIDASDRGLAVALAGDPQGGVQLLMEAARAPGANATVRQNLALALALSGQWQAARVTAATDMSPADVDARMQQWAAFAQPKAASDQVSTLLGVVPTADAGQPAALALNAPAQPPTLPAAEPAQVAAAEPALPALAPAEHAAPVPVAAAYIAAPVATPVVATAAPTPAGATAIAWGPRREVVQALPVPLIRPDASPARLALAKAIMTRQVAPLQAAAAPTGGSWHVQLGAYRNTAVARDAWHRFVRHAAFAGRVPNGATIKANGAELFRLSVGGLSRTQADAMCRSHRARGGACFVRAGAGDQMVRWNGSAPQWMGPMRAGVQLAARS